MQQIYYNGTIITMENELYAQAVLVNDGIIAQLGDFTQLHALAPGAELIDLAQHTLLPAFIDAHSHFSSYANSLLQASLEGALCFDDIAQRIKAFMSSSGTKRGQWIVANGYDHNVLSEKCQPTLELLDSICPHNPLILQHKSGHCGVLNTLALSALDITCCTPAPSGGIIGLEDGKLTGYMEEAAYIASIKRVPTADFVALLTAYSKAQAKYLAYGITTVQEGMMVAQMLPLYKALMDSGLLSVDVVGYCDMASMQELASAFPLSVKKYNKHFKIGGYKIFLDGSPQVKTAWMQAPYKDSGDYCGYGTMTDAQVLCAIEKAVSDDIQLLAHCNGDAAIQQYIDAIGAVAKQQSNITRLKPVIIHSQLITKAQLQQAAALHIIPSFFIAHILHWGDIHIANFGYDRAQYISPAHTALSYDIPFTFHQDAPVIEPSMLETVQCAVTRRTKAGVTLGDSERISVLEALKAITVNAAYQYSELDIKGSLRQGKHADFVILSDNPLTYAEDKISDIAVLATIKDGHVLYTK